MERSADGGLDTGKTSSQPSTPPTLIKNTQSLDLVKTLDPMRLHWAPFFKQADLLVRKAGAELETIDGSCGMAALHQAVNQGQERMASHLISLGAGVNQRDADSMTPLHLAVLDASLSMAALLLGHGADANAADAVGRTPMHYVAAFGDPFTDPANITRLLMSFGADLGARDARNRTPAELARDLGEVDTADFLFALERGDGSVEDTAIGMRLPENIEPLDWNFVTRRGHQDLPFDELLRVYRLGKGTTNASKRLTETETATMTTEGVVDGVVDGGGGGGGDGGGDHKINDRMYEPFRRYDGKDWADGVDPEKIKELAGLMETFPAAFFTEEQFELLKREGVIVSRLEQAKAEAREIDRRAAATAAEYHALA